MRRRRLAAIGALLAGAAAPALAALLAAQRFPHGVLATACIVLALATAWLGIVRGGAVRTAGLLVAAALVAAAVAIALAGDNELTAAALVADAALAVSLARMAFRIHVALPGAAAPRHPVLFYNPRSGGGKAQRFDLPSEAAARSIEAVELAPGQELGALVREAIAGGADALAMAGGDGSQALVAAIASEHDLPYACIPAGTRNHFALDLGVDRDDVVGALDAFTDGGERRVDLAEVNGRVFVNNVSLGLYATAVRKEGYRDAKLRTLVETVPEVLGPDAEVSELVWTGPHGTVHRSTAAILVSNNRYRLGRPVGSGTRPRIDDGLLGITVLAEPSDRGRQGRRNPLQRPWREWAATEFEVRSEGPVAGGIDGEAAELSPPLRFRILPGALRVRIARFHPGASPSAIAPDGAKATVAALLRIAAGRPERVAGSLLASDHGR